MKSGTAGIDLAPPEAEMVKPDEPAANIETRKNSFELLEIEIMPDRQRFEEFVASVAADHENQRARQVFEWELLRKRSFHKVA